MDGLIERTALHKHQEGRLVLPIKDPRQQRLTPLNRSTLQPPHSTGDQTDPDAGPEPPSLDLHHA